MKELSIILKLAERCNLNCSYCYYFNGVDKSFEMMPAIINQKTIDQICKFLIKGIKDLGIQKIVIGFHGGEPLLYNKERFKLTCIKFNENLLKYCELKFNVQTNGTLIDEEWIKIFIDYNVDIGISLDGPSDYHDEYRVTHTGKGSYNKIKKSMELLERLLPQKFGVLCVINEKRDARKIYRHFVDDLKITSFDFLLPDIHHSSLKKIDPIHYGKFLCDLFDEWIKDDNPEIQLRMFNSYIKMFLGGESMIYGIGYQKKPSIPLITIRSNGNLSPTDELMSTDPNTMTHTGFNISNTSLKEFLNQEVFKEILNAQLTLPSDCLSCCWGKVCGGGGITNRFSESLRFNNPSIYCDGLKIFYKKLLIYLLDSGVPLEQIKKSLCL